jgi:C-terminal peptidase prc
MIDEKNKVGYIRLTGFIEYARDEVARFPELRGKGTAAELEAAIDALKKEGMKSLVLDLRFNGGGYLTSAEKICELFVGREKIVSIRPRPGSTAGDPEVYRGKRNGDKNYKLVVLVNGESASASEIVAACLQDHERAIVMGEKSYGKGSVQQMLEFRPTGGIIKLTIARYYPPSDRNIDKIAAEQDSPGKEWGVTPDRGFEVKLTREESADLYELLHDLERIMPASGERKQLAEDKDRQLKSALDYLRKEGGNKGGSK